MFTLSMKRSDGHQFNLNWKPYTLELAQEDGTPVDLAPLHQFYPNKTFAHSTQHGGYEKQIAHRVGPDDPVGKSHHQKNVRIIFGLACNFSCSYCSQARARHLDDLIGETSDVEDFVKKLPQWLHNTPDELIRFEFWGGESLVYWKKIKRMAEMLRALYPNAYFWLPTNGSLMTREMNKWLFELDFHIAFSHDGPGQHHRGPEDPLDDPEAFAAIAEYCDRMTPRRKFNINLVMTYGNHSYEKIVRFFADKFRGHQFPMISCEGLVLAHSKHDKDRSPETAEAHHEIRTQLLSDVVNYGLDSVSFVGHHIGDFATVLLDRRTSEYHGQGCGLDRQDNITLKLNGDVVICPNGSAPDQKIGSVYDFESIELRTTHWSHREGCNACPVMPLCGGACMMFEGENHAITCDNHFTYHLVFFAYVLRLLTGATLHRITGDKIRFSEIKQFDYWSPCEIRPKAKFRTFPIPVVADGASVGCPSV